MDALYKDLVNKTQIHTIINDVCQKAKIIFVSKKALQEEISALNSAIEDLGQEVSDSRETIESLISRVEILESYHTTPDNNENVEPEPEPEENP